MSDHSIATRHTEVSRGWKSDNLPTPKPNLPEVPKKQTKTSRIGIGRFITGGISLAIVGIVALEIIGIPGVSPMAKLGESWARFQEQSAQGDMRVQLCLAKQHEISQRVALLEAEYSEWQGKCGLVTWGANMLNTDLASVAGAVCQQGTQEYYQTAIDDLHAARDAIKEC